MPSRRFVGLMCAIVGVAVLFFVVTSRFGVRASFGSKKSLVSLSADGTLGDAVTRDSNANGISDWEEILWGFDPATDGPSNKKAIEKKKREAGIAVADAPENATQTELFSQSLLSTILALQQSGSVTPEAITNLAASMGDTVDTKHAEHPVWTEADMRIVADTAATKAAYKTALKAAIDRQAKAGLGEELSIIAAGFGEDRDAALKKLDPIGRAYTALAEEIIALPTPRAAADQALVLANGTVAMGASLGQVRAFYDDVLSGMVGLDDYLRAGAQADGATDALARYFGI